MTYAELCAAIADTIENSFTDDQLATFVKQAEQLIFHTVQLPSLRKNATITMTLGSPYVNAPADMLSIYSFAVIDANGLFSFMLNKDTNYIREAYPAPTATGVPKYYAIFGPQEASTDLRLLVGPTPAGNYSAELHYFFLPESIVTAGTTWLGEHFDSALLNGALVEAIRFTKGEADMVKLYQDKYMQAMALLKNLGDGKLRQDAYRSGQTRSAVV